MAKQKVKKPQNIVCECRDCFNSITNDNKVYCGNKLKDRDILEESAIVDRKIDCGYFGVRK